VEGDRIAVRARGAGDRLIVEIDDSGPGIAPDELPRIFDRFYRADGGRRPRSGTGLGLAISQDIVRAHGGTIAVTSDLGVGTRFRVDVPGFDRLST
jgi:signal transduction histidine kinase